MNIAICTLGCKVNQYETQAMERELVRRGRVTVDGQPARSAEDKADPETASILVDGQPLGYRRYTWLMLNKPAGVLSATEDGRGKTVLDLLPQELRRQGGELAFISLEVRESNQGARTLYDGLGYREAGRRRGYYFHPKEDAIIMTLELKK